MILNLKLNACSMWYTFIETKYSGTCILRDTVKNQTDFFMVYKLYFTGTSHLREENLVPWGHVKYRFHCTSIWFCYSDNHAVMAKSFK